MGLFGMARDLIRGDLTGYLSDISTRDQMPDWTYPGASTAATLISTYGSPNTEQILPTFVSQSSLAYGNNAVVFSVILARLMLFSEATFKWQSVSDKKLFGDQRLSLLERPWVNGTTGELLARMEQDVSLAGNAYVWNAGPQLVRLRPDLITIVSEEIPDALGRPYRVPVGYFYDPARGGDFKTKPMLFDVSEVAHWSPIPDPMASFRGMSWLSPVVREVFADNGLTDYKIQYLENAATPNIMIRYDQKLEDDTLNRLSAQMEARHGGIDNAFRTLILDEGATLDVVGNSLEQMAFTTVQAAGENRIAAAGGVPGIVVGLKEGLMAATYSNYAQAMRRFADLTMRPQWRSVCAALHPIIAQTEGAGVRLWYDTSDIAALQQGEQERAATLLTQAQTADSLVKAGYEEQSVVDAIVSGDLTQLKVAEKAPPLMVGKDFLGQPLVPTGTNGTQNGSVATQLNGSGSTVPVTTVNGVRK